MSETDVTVCPKCGGKKIRQEEDVLDTWFSSALWPFSTLGWPNDTDDLRRYYPTSTLVTGYDIITFWVSKMIFMGLEFMDEKPFSDVFIHGLVRDAQGRKMSKSLGNGIDPLDVIAQYGADALRYTLASGNAPGNDMRFSTDKVEAARNFANKLWNASRFVLMNLTGEEDGDDLPPESELAPEDKWILTELNRLIRSVTDNLDKYEIGVALAEIYDFTWDVLCDWYIELIKPRLFDKESESAEVARKVIVRVLSDTLKLLHPYMPFITEEIYLSLPHDSESIMIANYPTYDPKMNYPEDAAALERIITVIRAIRNRRAEMNVPPSKRAKLYLVTPYADDFRKAGAFLTKLASASEYEIVDGHDSDGCVRIVTDAATVFIPLGELVDLEKEKQRTEAELARVTGEIERIGKKLANEGFVSKAPAAVVDAEREKLKKYEATRAGLIEALEKLNS